jgi:phage shock protein B
MESAVLAVLLIFGFPLLVVAGFFTIWALKIVKGGKDQQRQDEEARLIQELHHGLNRMESRIEALETLLLDPDRQEPGKGSQK